MKNSDSKDFEEEPLDEISKALGASRQFKLPKYDHGPLGWLHMAHDVAMLRAYEQQKAVMESVLWQPSTEGVEAKLFDIKAPIPIYT
jgi:hypothetical protein